MIPLESLTSEGEEFGVDLPEALLVDVATGTLLLEAAVEELQFTPRELGGVGQRLEVPGTVPRQLVLRVGARV